MFAGAKKPAAGCAGTKKEACSTKKDCVWVPTKGCRIEDNLPLAVLAKIAAKAKKVVEAAPKAEKAAPKPKVEEAAPKPKVEKAAPKPKVEEAAPKPKVEKAAPKPKVEKAAPKPKVEKAAPKPKAEKKTKVAPKPTTAEAKANRAARMAVLRSKKAAKAQKGGAGEEEVVPVATENFCLKI
jgi:outer membrane biosynthesis protein TonB